MKRVLPALLFAALSTSAFGQSWQVPINTIPYGKGPGKTGFGSAANSGTGTQCLLDTIPPSFGACSGSLPTLNNGRIFVGNASNAAVAVAMSGDCTIVAAGAITCTKTNGIAFGQATGGTSAAILSKRLSYGYWVDLDFGAVCDGTTNTATAINNAITQVATNGGGVLNFPALTCAISSTINLVQGVTLNGQGPIVDQLGFTQPATTVSKIKWTGGATGTMIATPAGINSNVGITNLTLDGRVAFGSLGGSALKGIKIGSGFGAKIQGVVIANVGHGISLEPGYGVASPPLISWGDYRNISMTYVGTGIDFAPNTTIGMTSGGVTNNNFYNIVIFEPVNYGLNFWGLSDNNHFHGALLDTSTVGATLIAVNTLDPTNPVGVYSNSMTNMEISCNDAGSGAGIHPLTVNNTNGFGIYVQGQFFNCEAPTVQNSGVATIIDDVNPNYVVKAWKPYNGFTGLSLQNGSAGGSATVGLELGNNASSGLGSIVLNSSTNSTLGGVDSLNIANVNTFPVAISVDGMVRNKTTNTGVEITGNLGVGTSSAAAQLHTTGTVRFAGLAGAGTLCASLDPAGNMGRTACGGTGLPGAGSLSQVVLNSGAGTGAWATEPFTNISLLTGVDCTGTVATVISTAISTIKSVALPTNCTLKVTGNDTIPAGVFFSIPCGARVQVDGAAILIFNALTDDNTCQKFTASGAGAGAGGGIVKGLRFNRPEWWGAAGDCNYSGACTHDDFGPIQQAFNSAQASNASSGDRAQVKFACGKGYGVSTGVVATATRNAPLLISGCAPLSGGNSEGGSAIYGRTAFAGIALTITGNTTTNIEIRDLEIASIDQFGTDVCLQIGSAGNTLSNASGHSLAQNLRLSFCKHLLKFGGSVVSFQFDRIWMVMGNNGGASGANSSCIEAIPNAEVLSELTFNSIACDGGNNSDASAICLNFHSQGASGGISGTRINDVSCYQPTNGLIIKAEGASSIPDFWCYSCQMDAMRVGSVGYSITTTGTATIADVVLDKTYITNVGAPDAGINIDGSAGGTIKNIGIYGPYMATGGTLRGIRVTDAQTVQIQGARIGGTYVNQGVLLNNCAGCMANNNIFSGTVPNFVLLGGSTDFSQACNNTGSGALAPAAVSGSVAAGTHNIFFGSGYQSCPNN